MSEYLVPPERLAHPRFVLRSFLPGDGERLARATRESYTHLAPWMPWPVPDPRVEDSERLAREARGRWLLAQDFWLLILSSDEREVLGGTGFHLRAGSLAHRNAEVGMWIHAAHAGRGLGTVILRSLLAWGCTDWPWERLEWRCDTLNLASRRCAEKAGMQLEGVLRLQELAKDGTRRDTAVYAHLREAR